MSLAQKKIKEAEEKLKAADKCVKKTLFKWKPDWDTAGPLYEQAGLAFRQAKEYDRSKEAYIKGAEAQYNALSTFMAAKNSFTAAGMATEAGHRQEAVTLYRNAARYYMENGTPEKAAESLVKAGTTIVESDPEEAMELYYDACEMYKDEEKEAYAGDAVRRTVSLLLKHERYDKTIALYEMMQKSYAKYSNPGTLFKSYVAIVIILLHCQRYDEASEKLEKFLGETGFFQSGEGQAINELMDAFERADEESFQQVRKKHKITFSYLDSEVSRLALNLPCPAAPLARAAAFEFAPTPAANPAQGGPVDGDEEIDLLGDDPTPPATAEPATATSEDESGLQETASGVPAPVVPMGDMEDDDLL
eukprot:GCRY01001992.1.p1 GENE.GCRY01001992.1~~GCRY01001992.1.p1  ORF type:complete len:362 (+),score=91.07 GCRY01001992.1:160-1245(+)